MPRRNPRRSPPPSATAPPNNNRGSVGTRAMAKPPKERRLLEAVSSGGDSNFARALGSSEYHTREQGLRALTAWLSRRADVDDASLLKLWKGVFYCFWHSDKAAVQAALAERLAEVMGLVPAEVGARYYQACMRTMRREWAGIDRLRLDKFMLLLRRMTAQLLRTLQGGAWDAAQLACFAAFWQREVLCPADGAAAAGVAYHLADTLLPELRAVVAAGGGRDAPPPAAALAALLEPFCAALAGARDPGMVYRLQQGLFRPLVAEVEVPSEGAPLAALDAPALAARLFELALHPACPVAALGALPETKARSREALYALSAALEKAASKAAKRPAAGEALEQPQARQHEQRQQEQPAAAAAEPVAAAVASAEHKQKKKKKRKAVDAAAGEGAPAANGLPHPEQPQPPSEQEQHAPQQGAAPAKDAPAPTPKPKKKAKGLAPAAAAAARRDAQRHQRQRPEAAAAAAGATPGAAVPGDVSPTKKAVKFSLRKNLVMTIGQPPLPADVRTPPTSRPKGSALKKVSSVDGIDLHQTRSAPERLTRGGASRLARASGPAPAGGGGGPAAGAFGPGGFGSSKSASKAAGGGGVRKHKAGGGGAGPRRLSLKSPGSVPRPRASEFF
eukprot:scaffold8.g1477.t1